MTALFTDTFERIALTDFGQSVAHDEFLPNPVNGLATAAPAAPDSRVTVSVGSGVPPAAEPGRHVWVRFVITASLRKRLRSSIRRRGDRVRFVNASRTSEPAGFVL
jgi:hypothetical protein